MPSACAGCRSALAVQQTPTGMLDAILLARDAVERRAPRRVLITWCDQMAISPETVAAVGGRCRREPEPDAGPADRAVGRAAYVHLERDAAGRIVRVLHRREGDDMPASGETDAGVFDLSAEAFFEWLPEYAEAPRNRRAHGRTQLRAVRRVGRRRGQVVTVPCPEPEEAIGINTPEELQRSRRTFARGRVDDQGAVDRHSGL